MRLRRPVTQVLVRGRPLPLRLGGLALMLLIPGLATWLPYASGLGP